MFYQLSVFVIFQIILDDPLIRHRPDTDKVYTFADDIVTKFFTAAESNPYLFASVLFWKTRVDSLIINGGYSGDDSSDERITKVIMDEWSPEEDKKATDAFEMYKESATALDLVVAVLGENRTTAQVYKRLEVLKLLSEEHKKLFAAAAKEAKHIRDPSEKITSKSAHYAAKKLASQRSGRGPQAVEWLKEKIDEAAMLRERFAVFTDDNALPNDSTTDANSKCTPHEIIPTGEEELGFNRSVTKLMRKLGFTPPPRGKPFWIIPAGDNFTAAKLKAVLGMLKDAQDEAQLEKEQVVSEKEKKKKKDSFVVDDEGDEKENENDNRMVLETDSEDDKQKKKEKKAKEKKKRERERERKTEKSHEDQLEEPISEEENDGRRKSTRRAEKKRKEKRKIAGFKRKVAARQDESEGDGSDEDETTAAPEVEQVNKKRRLKKRATENETGAAESIDIAPPLSAEGVPIESLDIAAPVVVENFDESDEEVIVRKADKKKKKMVEDFDE